MAFVNNGRFEKFENKIWLASPTMYPGVAIGTAIAMFYQTIWMAFYDSKNLIKWPFTKFLKQIAVDFITVFFLHIIANPEIGGKISVINRIFVLSRKLG